MVVQVFDVRGALHPVFTLPFASPCLLTFHPGGSATLVAGSPDGVFGLVDVNSGNMLQSYQVDTQGGWVGGLPDILHTLPAGWFYL